MINTGTKHWKVEDGVLAFEQDDKKIVPTADQIYSAAFENAFSRNVESIDIGELSERISFSKYPVSIYLIIEPGKSNTAGIRLSVKARSESGDESYIDWERNADHIVIGDTWYPFLPDARKEIENILTEAGIFSVGSLRLGQYLLLIKEDNELIINDIKEIGPDLYFQNFEEKPEKLKATLYPYQQKGWQWLNFMRHEDVGGILADEMGLGKTLQIIALLITENKSSAFPSLIICPTTLLENWRREFLKFAPHVSTYIHQGPQRTGFPADLKKYDVVISSYDTVVRDSSLFCQINWKVVICDEAQAIKNPDTRRANAVKKVPRKTGFAVTGTPIENRLTDLWSIMDFSVPGFLGTKADFEASYGNGVEGAEKLEKLVSPLILRRMVSEVAKDLPAKIIIPQVIELTADEEEHYERIRVETEKEFQNNSSLVVLIRLRMFCTHPFLLADIPGGDPARHSNKYSRLVEIAEEVFENGAKLLVFTSYNKMNDIIVDDFATRFGIYCGSIDGRTPPADRQKIVDEFSNVNGPAVMVLNPIAAGAGLNITAANHVIHYNLEWNPAKEDQASARAYRRGQDRPVTIHRLIYANTVDEAIDDRLSRKRELAGTVLVGVQGEDDDYQDIVKAINKSPKHK